MSVLREWYCGKKYPLEEIVSKNKDYKKISLKLEEELRYFKDIVEDTERFEQMEELLLRSQEMEEYANFSYGFRLGAMLMCEIFSDCVYEDEKQPVSAVSKNMKQWSMILPFLILKSKKWTRRTGNKSGIFLQSHTE